MGNYAPRIVARVVERRQGTPLPASILLWQWFLQIVNAYDLTMLATTNHVFPGDGLTGCVVLREGHAAIYTVPDEGYMWTELATCGDPATLDVFEALISAAPFDIAMLELRRRAVLKALEVAHDKR